MRFIAAIKRQPRRVFLCISPLFIHLFIIQSAFSSFSDGLDNSVKHGHSVQSELTPTSIELMRHQLPL